VWRRAAHAVWRREELGQRLPRTGHRSARRVLRMENGGRQPRPRARMSQSRKRRVCFPITSRAYYGRSQLLIRKLHQHPAVDLELLLGGTILLDKYSRYIADDIKEVG